MLFSIKVTGMFNVKQAVFIYLFERILNKIFLNKHH